MTRRLRGFTVRALLFLGFLAAPAAAQSTMTVTGHVMAANAPVRGARVRIELFDLTASTDENGRYSLIIPSARVRGQTVQITITYPRFATATADIALVGGNVIRDVELVAVGGNNANVPPGQRPSAGIPGAATAPVNAPVSTPQPTATLPAPTVAMAPTTIRAMVPVQTLDSTVFTDVAGFADVATVLEGRMAGVDVQTSAAPGGTNSIIVRGTRTLFGNTQPLVVVNGIIIDNSNITTSAQRSGLGGFDYGTLLSDLNVEDIASLQLLAGPEAALRYGGRAANGVLVVTTRSARGLNGFELSASQQIVANSVISLPNYQNSYGQGLGGKFAFFDGKGGGINDATDESWGPALDGTPVLQASLLQPQRGDVRAFSALPGNVSGYFRSGHALATNVSLLGGNATGYIRGSLASRSVTGVVPATSVATRSALVTGGAQPTPRISLIGDVQYYNTVGEDRPGSGFDESNVVSTFSHMPRQIDVATYQTHLRDATGAALSWNYAGRNNPWFATLENRNHDDRSRLMGGGTATFALSNSVAASARIGVDHSSDSRTFSVASGWQGGYPYSLGRGNFSTGGFENDDITRNGTNAELIVRAAPHSASGMNIALSGGIGRRADDLDFNTLAADNNTTTPSPVPFHSSASTNFAFGGLEALVRDLATLTVGVRGESSSPGGGSTATTVYPAVVGTLDLTRIDSGPPKGLLQSFIVHAGWSKAGNDATTSVLQRLGFAAGSSTSELLASVANPEVTTGFEAGASMSMMNRRFTADLTVYSDRTESLVFPSAAGFLHSGTLSNKGVEGSVLLVPVRTPNGAEWTVGANISKNTSSVESLGGAASVALATPFNGVSVEARPGQPLGALVGLGYLRDASGTLLLRNGLPVADSAKGVRVLAQSAPSWIGGLTTAYHGHGVEFSVLVDAHHGGKVFSASNRAGAISGVLEETAFRPDTGLLIAGIDAATGNANAKHVTTEQYYHALAPIAERWLYDASFVKLRELRFSYVLPLAFVNALQAQSLRASFIARNITTWKNAPNIDPETVLSTSPLRGAELGQLPSVRSIGLQITLVP